MGKRGPKPTKLDWDKIITLISYHLTQEDVASFFNISVDTLEKACVRDRGEKLTEFWAKKKTLGRTKLRQLQFEMIERGGAGAAAVAIYLDKRFFGDPEKQDQGQGQGQAKTCTDKKDFKTFCRDAGYPEPFDKQVEMKDYIFENEDPRLLLGSRGYGKTDYVTILGTAYDIYLDPKSTNLIITDSRIRNTAIIEEIGAALKANGVELEKENTTRVRVKGLVGKDDSCEVLTLRSSFKGRHHKRILFDDPVTEGDVSEAKRLLLKRKYDEAFKLCSNIGIIGQYVHAFDLYNEIEDRVLNMRVPHGTIIELDHDLKAMEIAGVDPVSIQMSYHLKVPKDGSSIFANLKYVDHLPLGDSVAFIDPSDGGDYTAITVFKQYLGGIAIYGKVWKKAWYHCLDDLGLVFKEKSVKRACFETNLTGTQPIHQLRKAFAEMGIGIVGKASVTNKHAMIVSAGSMSHLIHLSKDSDKIYTDQVVKYDSTSKHDDAPDSLARGLEWLGLLKGAK